jgi:hypothetical protein
VALHATALTDLGREEKTYRFFRKKERRDSPAVVGEGDKKERDKEEREEEVGRRR